MRTKHPILRRDISRRQSRIERFRRCLCSVCDAGSQTVSALKGDVPGGSLERLGEPSRYLTVVWNASMSEPRHPLCEGYYTRLVGLRRSLARNGGSRMGHSVLYVCLGIAYLEAAFESFGERKRHCACREIVIACLYVTGALI